MKLPRMLLWLVLTLVLITLAYFVQERLPGSLIAVTLYKAHLFVLGGCGGYWLDRALSPYDRPHNYMETMRNAAQHIDTRIEAGKLFQAAMLRRAVIVAACLICVGLGA